ncbi:DNA-methyltransferase [Leuconostoc mesenteroides]|uniref:DNA-methyltransferase n=1 Tax=Leuconostoc mesenteroides TaxID=1245 RepID=UPI0016803861|nr:site-specific DNA-methyltransferase [Leuconostoc mesenteroides]
MEEILIFYKKLPTYNPQMGKGFKHYFNRKKASLSRNYKAHGGTESKSNGERFPIDVLEYAQPSVSGKGVHPTQKPVDLLEYLKTYRNPGDVVLDNTMGSGSTGVAAINLKRDFIGIELDKHYYEIAQKRTIMTMKNSKATIDC